MHRPHEQEAEGREVEARMDLPQENTHGQPLNIAQGGCFPCGGKGVGVIFS